MSPTLDQAHNPVKCFVVFVGSIMLCRSRGVGGDLLLQQVSELLLRRRTRTTGYNKDRTAGGAVELIETIGPIKSGLSGD